MPVSRRFTGCTVARTHLPVLVLVCFAPYLLIWLKSRWPGPPLPLPNLAICLPSHNVLYLYVSHSVGAQCFALRLEASADFMSPPTLAAAGTRQGVVRWLRQCAHHSRAIFMALAGGPSTDGGTPHPFSGCYAAASFACFKLVELSSLISTCLPFAGALVVACACAPCGCRRRLPLCWRASSGVC